MAGAPFLEGVATWALLDGAEALVARFHFVLTLVAVVIVPEWKFCSEAACWR